MVAVSLVSVFLAAAKAEPNQDTLIFRGLAKPDIALVSRLYSNRTWPLRIRGMVISPKCWNEVQAFLKPYIGKEVACKPLFVHGSVRSGDLWFAGDPNRIVGDVGVAEVLLPFWLIAKGYARWDHKLVLPQNALANAESIAKNQHAGMWANPHD